MNVLFWNECLKRFVVRGIVSDDSYELPDGDEAWTVIDDSVCGRLDAVALALRYAKESGWRNYEITFQDCQ